MPNAQFNKLTLINDNSLVKSVSVISLSSAYSKIGQMIKSLLYFLWAGLFEIGGGYLIWLWLRESKPFWWGILGGIALAFYGIIATLQSANFGRVYAAYGGVFIAMAMLWGWKVDGVTPDRYDLIGVCLALMSVLIIMFAPRT